MVILTLTEEKQNKNKNKKLYTKTILFQKKNI